MSGKEKLNLTEGNRVDISGLEGSFIKIAEKYKEEGFSFDDSKYLESCYEKALQILQADTINMDDFADLYDVENDKKYIEKIEAKFSASNIEEEEKNAKIATILEAILHEQIEQNCYLGDNITTKRTSRYDDIVNGIDDILEIENEGHHRTADHLAIVVDATFSKDIEKKIKTIKEGNEGKTKLGIRGGELGKLKYFESEFLDIRGEKKGIPKFILGIDRQNLESITALWYENRGNLLAKHPLQIIIIEEIIKQAEYFKDYALGVGQKTIAQKYEKLYQIFTEIKKEKESESAEILSKEDNKIIINNDGVYSAIKKL